MKGLIRAGMLTGVAAMLVSIGPASDDKPSAATLAMLDPSAQAATLCGRGAFDGLRARLRLAALFSTPASAAAEGGLPLFASADTLSFVVTTANAEARRYFLQGLMLAYNFNHLGAVRSFKQAQRLDPNCAACFWAEALAYGPNINAGMNPEDLPAALAALAKAQSLKANASPAEQTLIDALALRYVRQPPADRAPLDAAYADAMLAVAQRFPDQDDIALLAAEAAMDTSPWNYWQVDRKTPQPRLGEAIRLVEAVLARNPNHPQAAHLYIHLVEAVDPARAEAAADRLTANAPAFAGHLIHMPAHIYIRRGRFQDSIASNLRGAKADEAYFEASGDKGLYRYGYYPHNVHFIVTSAQMAGDMGAAVDEARRLSAVISADAATQYGWVQAVAAAPYLAYAQVAAPEQILALDAPDPRLSYVVAMRHYARALAYAQRRDRAGFNRELAALRETSRTGKFDVMVSQGVPAPELLSIADLSARGRMAYARGRYAEAARLYREAATIEDRLPYMEPPWWYYPVRQSLGATLYRAKRYAEARQAFQEALASAPGNGWALYGLGETERALGHRVEAAAADDALQRAWIGKRDWLSMDRL